MLDIYEAEGIESQQVEDRYNRKAKISSHKLNTRIQ